MWSLLYVVWCASVDMCTYVIYGMGVTCVCYKWGGHLGYVCGSSICAGLSGRFDEVYIYVSVVR